MASTSAARKSWTHLIRFIAREDGQTYIGDLGELPSKAIYEGLKARVIRGDPLGSYEVQEESLTVKKLLSPLSRDQVPMIRCVGLNYGKHVAEDTAVNRPPKWPAQFIKPRTCLSDPDTDVEIPKIAQDNTADYEGELAIVIGKDCKNVPNEGEAWRELVAGYACSDDVTWRTGQKDFDISGTQWNLGKGLDNFAPLGPILVSSQIVDPADLSLELRLNGKTMQKTRTSDMISNVRVILHHFSKGTTLERGTVILSGTPEGVGYAQKPTPVHLKAGDQIEVEIEGLGVLRHGITHE